VVQRRPSPVHGAANEVDHHNAQADPLEARGSGPRGDSRAAAVCSGRRGSLPQRIEFFASEKTLEQIHQGEKIEFREKTGLLYPMHLTEVGQYGHLAEQIARHQRYVENIEGRPLSFQSAAAEWYRTIYSPLVGIIQKGGLMKSFPERSETDLYAFISYHQWEKGSIRKYGGGIDELLCKNMEEFREKMSGKKEVEYPEMLREITAFVLMKVSGKREDRIIESFTSSKR
jgi:hypothetical protein